MQFTVTREKDGMMLSKLLLQVGGMPPWAVKQVINKRDVRINNLRISDDCRVCEGQEIRVYWSKEALASQKQSKPTVPIVFEDEHVLVINKPQGLQSQNEENPLTGDSALTRVLSAKQERGEQTDQIRLCHRLDVQTGGLLLFTKDEASYEAALEAFEKRTMEKYYTCLVKGCPAKSEAVMHAYLRKDAQLSRVVVTDYPAKGALEIVTGYRVLEASNYARLEVELMTGRTHQIRAHLAHIGHPILGDDKYGDRALNRKLGLKKQQLWSTRLVFHTSGALAYLEGKSISITCPF